MMYSAVGKNRITPTATSASGRRLVSPGRRAVPPNRRRRRKANAIAPAAAPSATSSRWKLYRWKTASAKVSATENVTPSATAQNARSSASSADRRSRSSIGMRNTRAPTSHPTSSSSVSLQRYVHEGLAIRTGSR